MSFNGPMGSGSYTGSFPGGSGGNKGRATARRASGGLLFFRFDTAGMEGSIRDLKGRFISAQSQIVSVNRAMALALAEAVVEALYGEGFKRPASSTGRLAAAIMDPKDRVSDVSGFGVGVISFLDESQAKYWRAIEQGTTHFLGNRIYGLWSSNISGEVSPGGQYGPYPAAQPEYTIQGRGTGQRLRPMTRRQVYAALTAQGMTSKEASRSLGGQKAHIITKAIEAHSYFQRGWTEFDMPRQYVAAIQEVFRSLGLPVPTLKA